MVIKIKEISVKRITDTVKNLCIDANKQLPVDIESRIHFCKECENNKLAKEILGDLEENISFAKSKNLPICQDTVWRLCFWI